ncbi:hypothetical protein V5G20_18005 [Brevibacillus borstelensis]|uniref:hypothetical protein n=1 Tax=Brevibacillus borstelensis TaxID=45462 RepID=UPI0030CE0DB2
MSKEKLNSLAVRYLETKAESVLEDLYKGVCAAWNVGRHEPDEHSIFNEVFWRVILRFNGGDFVNLLSFSFKNARIDLARRRSVRRRREVAINSSYEDEHDSSLEAKYLAADYCLEQEVIAKICKKKEADKIALIDFLLESAKIHLDSTMTAIIEEFPRHKNLYSLGKALGLSRNAVDRKIRSLGRHYDGNRFGDAQDYLAV